MEYRWKELNAVYLLRVSFVELDLGRLPSRPRERMALESGHDWIDRSCGALLGQRAGRLTLRLMLSLEAIFGLSVMRCLRLMA